MYKVNDFDQYVDTVITKKGLPEWVILFAAPTGIEPVCQD